MSRIQDLLAETKVKNRSQLHLRHRPGIPDLLCGLIIELSLLSSLSLEAPQSRDSGVPEQPAIAIARPGQKSNSNAFTFS